MVCCLIGAFILGMLFRAARWTNRSVRSALHLGTPKGRDSASIAPTPVYELPDYLSAPAETDGRVPELV